MVALFGVMAVGSILFTGRAVVERSPGRMWLAALCSLLVSVLLIFSIGGFVFLLTALQIAAAIALSRAIPGLTMSLALLLAVVIWAIFVPAQVYGPLELGGYGAYTLVGLAGLLYGLLLMVGQRQRPV